MDNKLIYVDTEKLDKEINNLKNEKEHLDIIIKNIKNVYQQFLDYNLEGKVIEEINNNYIYGLEITENLIQKMEDQIEKLEVSNNKYISTINEIKIKTGDNNE